MMPKGDTISAIRQLNPTADPTFLSEFSVEDLQAYLDRLTEPRRQAAHTVSTALQQVRSAESDPAEAYA